MITRYLDDAEEAAAILRAGGLVAFPTETVYGLGADATSSVAVEAIYRAKGRPSDNPLIVHVDSVEAARALALPWPASAERLLVAFAPGPITVVVPRGDGVTPTVSAGLKTVGLRIPSHPVAAAFLAACDRPVAAPSANRSGRPSPTTWEAVQEDLHGRIQAVLRGTRSETGLESTVVDCSGLEPVVLRAGAIPLEAIQEVAPGASMAGDGDARVAASPGTRHPHYQPTAQVRLVEAPDPAPDAGFIGCEVPPPGYSWALQVPDVAAYAHELYHFFRACDSRGLARIDCLAVDARGLGLALMDRIRRAAQVN